MKPPKVEFHEDHLSIELEGIQSVEALRRAVIIPYTTIENAAVGAPHWPGIADIRVGTHLPRLLARGSFQGEGGRRFLDIDRETKQALTIKLDGHAEFDEVTLDVPAPGDVLDRVSQHKRIAPTLPPVYE